MPDVSVEITFHMSTFPGHYGNYVMEQPGGGCLFVRIITVEVNSWEKKVNKIP